MKGMARVLMVASEAAPFVKTGGLADVLGGLPPALVRAGDEVAVILPRYRGVELYHSQRVYHDLPVWLAGTLYNLNIDHVVENGASYYFINYPPLYDREGIYNVANRDYSDNHVRFAVLCRAAMETVRRIYRPQVVHCHDWQAALVAPYIRDVYRSDPTFAGLKLLFTIHNLGYQGIFSRAALADMGLDANLFTPAALEFYGDVNLMKGGIVFSDWINTVSPTYAQEIQTPEFGFRLDGLLRSRANVLSGILNGVEYAYWNPEHDSYLPANYSVNSLDRKQTCKHELLKEFGLPSTEGKRPLIGIVSRFAAQKGFDLIAEIAGSLLSEDVSLVVLGAGDPAYEQMFRDLAAWKPDRCGVRIGYDNPLAHRIEAGSDMFLMPSRYEPCGLNQMYSLRYGTVPIVRATGGLNDTIDEGVGFKFHGYSGPALLAAIREALAAYRNQEAWQAMMRTGMEKDFSWNAAAKQYSALYKRLIAGVASPAAA
jgi:starch synthase